MRMRVLKIFSAALFLYVGMLVAGFFGVKYGLTNVSGNVDDNNAEFAKQSSIDMHANDGIGENEISHSGDGQGQEQPKLPNADIQRNKRFENACKIAALQDFAPVNMAKILEVYKRTGSDALVSKMIFAVYLRIKETHPLQVAWEKCEKKSESFTNTEEILNGNFISLTGGSRQNVFPWMNGDEWKSIEQAVVKDKEKIHSAAQSAGVEPRMIVASLIVEQLRLFYAQRELFEKVFQPLRILGNATKISLGVMGIKEATAIQIESNLKDPFSPYYLGSSYEHILDFQSNGDVAQERFLRLTNEKDHYFSYLYGALYLKQFLEQWKNAGYDIRYRMEIVGTLFNVGFPQSKPNSDPKVGGSAIFVGDGKYSFGSLAYEFYYSGALLDEFPYEVN